MGIAVHPRKKIYAKEIYNLMALICKTMSGNNAGILSVLNLSDKDAYGIINKMMIALPDNYFYNANTTMLYDMLCFITKNLILFQVQEDIDDENYAYHLIDFINSLSMSLATRYYHS